MRLVTHFCDEYCSIKDIQTLDYEIPPNIGDKIERGGVNYKIEGRQFYAPKDYEKSYVIIICREIVC